MSKLSNSLNEIINESREVLSQSSSNSHTQESPNFEDSAFGMKDVLLIKCRDTIENLYEEIELQKRQRRDAELCCKELEVKNLTLEKRTKELTTKLLSYKEELDMLVEQKENFEKESSTAKKSDNTVTSKISLLIQENEELKNGLDLFRQQLQEKNDAILE